MPHPAPDTRSHLHTIHASVFAVTGGEWPSGGPQNLLGKHVHHVVYLTGGRDRWFTELVVDGTGKVTMDITLVHQYLAVDP